MVVSLNAYAKPATRAWLDNKTLYVEYGGQKQMVDMEIPITIIEGLRLEQDIENKMVINIGVLK